jgi:hypothetical protein
MLKELFIPLTVVRVFQSVEQSQFKARGGGTSFLF